MKISGNQIQMTVLHVDGVTKVKANGTMKDGRFIGEYRFQGMDWGVDVPMENPKFVRVKMSELISGDKFQFPFVYGHCTFKHVQDIYGHTVYYYDDWNNDSKESEINKEVLKILQ